MSAVLEAPALASLTDDELAGAWSAADLDDPDTFAAFMAEFGRRTETEQAARRRAARMAGARRALDTIRGEAEIAVHAQFLAASEWTRGRLLSREGAAAGISERALWRMPSDDLARYASEELGDYFAFVAPRLTVAGYVRQKAAESRAARYQAMDETEITTTDEETADDHDHDRAGLAGDGPAALRRVAAAPQAPPPGTGRPVQRCGRGPGPVEAGQPAEAGARRPGRPVQPGRRDELTAIIGDRSRPVSERVDAYYQRAGAATRPVPAPVPVAPVRPPAGTVAVREPAQIPGDQLLDLIRDRWFGRYARFPSAGALDVVTLWAAHAHMRDADGVLVFGATPRLYLLSSEPGSGKSRVLELIGMIVPACFGLDVEPSRAGLVYSLAREHATVLLDEGDIMFGSGQRRADVRAVLNAGYRRHGTVVNGRGGKANRVPVFGAVAVAGLDSMVTGTGEALKALLTRGIKIGMRKAPGDDKPARLTRASEAEAAQARQWLATWAGQVRGELADAEPDMPGDLDGRQEEIWQPLVAIADAAGGQWPARARAALAELTMASPTTGADDGEDLAGEFASFAASFGLGGEDD